MSKNLLEKNLNRDLKTSSDQYKEDLLEIGIDVDSSPMELFFKGVSSFFTPNTIHFSKEKLEKITERNIEDYWQSVGNYLYSAIGSYEKERK